MEVHNDGVFMEMLKLIQDWGIAAVALAGFAYGVWQVGRAAIKRIVRIINNDGKSELRRPVASGDSYTNPKLRSIQPYDRPSLKTHFFFSTVNQLVTEEIEHIDCGCPARTLLFQDMCRTLALQWRDYLMNSIEADGSGLHKTSNSNGAAGGYNLGRDILAGFQRWRTDSEAEWRRSGIPDMAIRSFSEWVKPRLDRLRDTTGLIASSAFFDDNVQRLACIMAAHETAFRLIVLDLNNVIYSLNGRLDGYVYKNVCIIPIKDLVLAKIEAETARMQADERFRQKTTPEWSLPGVRAMTPLPGTLQFPPGPLDTSRPPTDANPID
jgi:hypothetical protein